MRISRRDLGILLPALVAAAATPRKALAQAGAPVPSTGSNAGAPAAARQKLTDSALYHHKAIPFTGPDTKRGRRFLYGETHGGFGVELHETILAVGQAAHPPHQHVHEEIVILVEGTIEADKEGKTEVLETGSVIWSGSNRMHGIRNVGKIPARYYVVELRGDEA